MKTCICCKSEKPKTEFNKRASSKDGLQWACRPCAAIYRSAWKKANPEKVAALGLAYRKANPEKISEKNRAYAKANAEKNAERKRAWHKANSAEQAKRSRAWRENNSERMARHIRAWRIANPDKVSANNRTSRARRRNADGRHSSADIKFLFDSQRGLCASCRTKLIESGDRKFHVDHIMPLARGGSNDKHNLQCLCPTCNLRKNAKHPDTWAAENGRLI